MAGHHWRAPPWQSSINSCGGSLGKLSSWWGWGGQSQTQIDNNQRTVIFINDVLCTSSGRLSWREAFEQMLELASGSCKGRLHKITHAVFVKIAGIPWKMAHQSKRSLICPILYLVGHFLFSILDWLNQGRGYFTPRKSFSSHPDFLLFWFRFAAEESFFGSPISPWFWFCHSCLH